MTGTATISVAPAPTTANAGPDQTVAGNATTLAATAVSTGTGAWSVISGSGGILAAPTSPASGFTGTIGTSYTLRWTTTNGSCTSSDDVVITFNKFITTVSVEPATGTYGGLTTLTATLKTSGNTGVSGQPVVFSLNGTSVGTATTNASGVATLANVSLGAMPATTNAAGVGASYAGNASYATSTGTGSLAISKASLVYKANVASRAYGAANPALNGTVTGFVNNETQASATTGTLAFTTPATALSAVGSYAINGSGLSAGNYSFGQDAANATALTITQAQPVVSWATPADITYGTALGSQQLNATTGVPGTYVYSPASGTILNAGSSQPLAVTFTPTDATNYLSATAQVTINVGQAPQTISFAALPARTFGAPDFELSASASSGLPVSFVVTGNATLLADGKTVHLTGAGPVTVTAAQAGDANHSAATSVAHSFSVDKAAATIVLGSLTQTYTGAALAATATTTPAGLSGLSLTYTQNGTAVASPTNAGTYTVTATLSNADYQAAPATGTLTIGKATATLTLGASTFTYDGTAKPVTATSTPIDLSGVSVTYDGAATAPTAAGSYQVVASLTNNNYEASNATGTLTINKAPATLTFGASTFTYDGAVKPVSVTTTPVGLGGVSVAYNGSAIAPAAAGTYALAASLDNPNYTAPNVAGTLLINKAAASIALSNTTATYDGTAKAVTAATLPAGLGGLSVTYTQNNVAVATPTNAGTYQVVASLTNDNYEASNATGTLTIGKAAATVTLANLSHTYTGTAKNVSFTTTPANLTGVNVTYDGAATTPTNAGQYAVVATLLNDNYAGSATGTLEIAQKELTVTADNQSKTYGDANPALTISYSGFVGAEGVSALTALPTAATTATQASTFGSYPITISGGSASNYSLHYVAGTLTVGKAELTVTATSASREYGEANPNFTATVTGQKNGDTFTTDGSTLAIATSAVGTYVITPTVNGSNLASYTVRAVPGTLTVREAPLTVTADNKTKVYGAANPAFTGTITGQKNNDSFTFGATTTATATSPVSGGSVSYAIAPTATGATLGNYTVNSVNGVLAITPKPLTASIEASNKVYDGTTATLATGSVPPTDVVGNDQLTVEVNGAAFNDKTVGAGKPVTATVALTGSAAGNYSLTSGVAATTAAITQAELVPSFTAASKEYDGTTAAAIITRAVSGRVAADAVSLDGGSASFADKQVGAGKTVTGTGFNLAGADAGNYRLTTPNPTTTASITAKALTITIQASSKEYDATDAATVAASISAGLVAGDEVTVTASNARFNNKNVGTGKPVTATVSKAGTDAANYSANPTASATADITPKALVISVTAADKTYDGTTAAAASAATASGLLSGDAVTVSVGAAQFANKNVGTSKSVTASVGKAGADADNYSANTTAVTTASITAKSLTVSVTAASKVYDGTVAATLLTRNLSGTVAGDDITLSGGTAVFADQHIGTSKTVTVTDLTLSGADNGNYAASSTATTTASITAKQLTASISATDKVYDGTDQAAATGSVPAAQLIAGETVGVAVSAAKFNDKNVGLNKTVTAAVALTGPAAGNYALTAATATTTATITAKPLTITITAANKTYDGTTTATTTAALGTGLVPNDVVTVASANGMFNNKTVGTGKPVTADVSKAGADAGNYAANTTASTTADITAKALVASITASNKVYDATTTATIATRTVSGQVLNDDVTLIGGTASFNNKDVGTGKPVMAVNLVLSGADAGNYSFNNSAMAAATITPLATTASFTAANKTYDGVLAATVVGRTVAGVLGADVVSLAGGTATFADKNVGAGKTVTLTGATLAGADAGNYSLTSVATTTAAITPKALLVTATGINKVFDGTTAATVTLTDNRVANDQLTPAYASATFATANTGTGIAVAVTGISISGPDAGNYTANPSASTSANITPASTVVTAVTNNGPVQYSDQVTLTATITSATAQAVLNATGGTVEFRLVGTGGTVSLGSSAYPGSEWSVVGGVATVTKSFVISQQPGTYSVMAVFTPTPSPSGNITGSTHTASGSLSVTKEDAKLVYSGLEYFGTANSGSTVANVEYITTVIDKADGFAGNITKSRAAFKEVVGTTETLLFGTNFAVASNSTTTDTVGTARTLVRTVTLSNAEYSNGGKTFDLITEVQGDYYTGRTAERTLITIAVPGQDYVNGGGSTLIAQSGGSYAATAGSRMNFGFTMKWNKSGKNIQGQANIIFRRLVNGVWRTYQIKSNAINTLGTATTAAGNQGDFNTKANLTDITDPLAPVSVSGNMDLSVQALESVVAGQAHKIGVTLRDGGGVLVFSSNWVSNRTAMQDLRGGKISVRSTTVTRTASRGTDDETASNSTQANTVALGAKASASELSLLEIYPNPTAEQATVHFHTQKGGKAQVYLYNQLGVLVATLYNAQVESGQDYYLPLARKDMADGVYFCRLIVNGQVQNKRLVFAR